MKSGNLITRNWRGAARRGGLYTSFGTYRRNVWRDECLLVLKTNECANLIVVLVSDGTVGIIYDYDDYFEVIS